MRILVVEDEHRIARSENTTIIAVTHDLSIAGKTDVIFRLSDSWLSHKSNGNLTR